MVAAIAGSSMVFIDGTAVNVALPILQRDFQASSADLQWVVEGYTLFLSALLLIGGSLGDRFGRKRIFAIGIMLFTLASIGCALATSIHMLNAARCLQGIGGALATPGSLALISSAYAGEARGRAIGTWSGFSAMTAAIGPLLGGWLAQAASWRFIFLINVPFAILVLFALARVNESRDAKAARQVDVIGGALATLGLGALVYGLIRLQGAALESIGLWAAIGGAIVLIGFAFFETRTAAPMVQPRLFRSVPFTVTNIYTFLVYAALGGGLYFVPFELINVQGYTPTAAGAALLPFIAIMVIFSRYSGGLVARVGARLPLGIGALITALGYASFAAASLGHSYWLTFFPAAIVLGVGMALLVAPLTTTVMDSVEPSHAGTASGINNAVSRTAGLVALAALGIALAGTFQHDLSQELARLPSISSATLAAVQNARAQIVVGRVPETIVDPAQRAAVAGAIGHAYTGGFIVAMLVSGALAALGGVLAFLFLPSRGPLRA
jgi:EmrB/QacA subfamily drug resistance transporter